MAKVNALTYDFATGEISRAGMARIDQTRVKLAAEIQENVFPHTIGKGLVRPGTGYLGNTASNAQARLISFAKSVSETAVLEFSDSLLRVWVSDALVTRASVSSTVINGDFSSSTGWTITTTAGATCNINSSDPDAMIMECAARGALATCSRSVATSSPGIEHALRIVVIRGPITFRCGSSSGDDDYIDETVLDTGTHSLAFTPAGTYYVYFKSQRQPRVSVGSIQVEAAGVMTLPAPWVAAELREIRSDQSIDIVYLAHTNWQQRKIERRGATSWSLVLYQADDGPFTTAPTATVTLTPSVLTGNGTLTSDQNFFTPEHVGALFQLTHTGQVITTSLVGSNVFTDTMKMVGPFVSGSVDRNFARTISGTWAGTITETRSSTSDSEGFAEDGSTFSGNAGPTTANDNYNNVTFWYRAGFKPGDYVSGAATVTYSTPVGGGFGICRVIDYSSPTSVPMEVLTAFKGTSSTLNWLEGEWSDSRGWPSAVAFFDGRLWWAREDKFWASESDDYTAFNLVTVGDAGSIQRAIAVGGSINSVNWMLPLQRLLFGTDGSEASARASSLDAPLTPTAITIKNASTQGSAPVSPAIIDRRGVYIQQSGIKAFGLSYSFSNDSNDYASEDLTQFNEEIGLPSLVEVAAQRQPQPYLWFVRSDGQCPVLLYGPDEKISAWFRFIGAPSLAGTAVVESVCVLPGTAEQSVYLSVKRTINGSTVRFVEKLRKHAEATGGNVAGVADLTVLNAMADAGTLTAGPVSSVTLAHLANETGLVGWGTTGGIAGPITGLSANGSGVIALPATYTNVWVGLKYDWRYKSAKLAYAARAGTALLQRKKVGPVGLLAADIMYGAIQFGPDFTSMDPLPLIKDGANVSQTTVYPVWDEPSFPFPGGWDTDSRLCMKGSAPYPATLLGIVAGVETHETV